MHLFRRADKFAEATCFSELPLEHGQLPRIAGLAEGAVEQRAQHRPFQRLLDVPEGAGFDAGDAMEVRPQLLEKVEAVHSGQFDVGNERVRLIAGKLGKHFLGGRYA